MTKPFPYSIKGLYVVTPDIVDQALLHQKVKSALDGGASVVQYRNKLADDVLLLEQANALLALCQSYQVPLIINDHVELCVSIGADGVHLGATDGDIVAARALLGKDKIIGVSCYNKFDLALDAQDAGATYVAFGACFSSSTKPNAVHAPLSLIAQAKQVLSLPVVGIGGITLDNAPMLIEAGADAIAVISDVFSAPDIAATSHAYSQLFS
jgi:thiamine-phosphate pyrophosphorylase